MAGHDTSSALHPPGVRAPVGHCAPQATEDPLPLLAPSPTRLNEEGLFLLDVQGRIQTWSAGAARVFGYSEAEVLGEPAAMLFSDPNAEETWRSFVAEVRTDRNTDEPRREVVACRKDGTTFPVDLSISRLAFAGRELFAGLARDLTQQKIVETRLQQTHKMEAMGQLAGGVAHDFNNLLMIVAGRCEGLRSQPDLSVMQRRALDQIATAVEQATSLTSRLLTFSRRPMMERRVLDLNVALLQTGELLRRTIREDIQLDIQLHPRPMRTRIDATHVGQILINLAVNARDAMPDGGIFSVRTRPVRLDAAQAAARDVLPGDFVMLEIFDNGPGMPADVKAHAFEPFFTTKPAERGTGLGLATVHGIVTTSGGHIGIESEPGQGVRFTILLPAAEEMMPREAVPAAPVRPPRGDETVLVVEDETSVREIVTTMLRELGYRTLEAGSVEEALGVGAAHLADIDLLVTDVVMPNQTGRELAERLWRKKPTLKVVFMSGHADDATLTRGIERAEVAFLQKPFNRLTLARRVREIIDQV